MNARGDSLVVISYHVGQTYQSTAAVEREEYYGTGLLPPYVILDGAIIVWEASPNAYYARYAQADSVARTVQSLFNIYILDATASATTGSIELRLVPSDTLPDDELAVFAAILEDTLIGAYDTFMHVCRELYTFPWQLSYPDSLDTTITFSHNMPVNRMKTVVFVQNIDTREIFQTTRSYFQEE
ncbi:MAG: hypothetical protein JSW02_07995 [candidate division WOR-3 bacterium]|nr:MAG: hypothetical protein JSW02_07995 [candidate division WOR-3 bacterium]